jgi:periplasmic divalent cation tolerance protein
VAVIAVLTNLPDSDSAFNLARELVNLRLAACANVLSPATSFYRWEGRDEQATEYPVLIKSTRERYPELEAAIRSRHPYSVPEIVAWPLDTGVGPYLDWVERECQRDPTPGPTP